VRFAMSCAHPDGAKKRSAMLAAQPDIGQRRQTELIADFSGVHQLDAWPAAAEATGNIPC